MTYQYYEQMPYISIYFNICSFFRNNSLDITKLLYFPIFLIPVSSGILSDDIFLLYYRHYGALQGLDKQETVDKYGKDQVNVWRR